MSAMSIRINQLEQHWDQLENNFPRSNQQKVWQFHCKFRRLTGRTRIRFAFPAPNFLQHVELVVSKVRFRRVDIAELWWFNSLKSLFSSRAREAYGNFIDTEFFIPRLMPFYENCQTFSVRWSLLSEWVEEKVEHRGRGECQRNNDSVIEVSTLAIHWNPSRIDKWSFSLFTNHGRRKYFSAKETLFRSDKRAFMCFLWRSWLTQLTPQRMLRNRSEFYSFFHFDDDCLHERYTNWISFRDYRNVLWILFFAWKTFLCLIASNCEWTELKDEELKHLNIYANYLLRYLQKRSLVGNSRFEDSAKLFALN